MNIKNYFFTPLKIKDNIDQYIISSLDIVKDCWEKCPLKQTLIYSSTNNDDELSGLKVIDNSYIDQKTDLFKKFYNYVEQKEPLPANLQAVMRYFFLPAGSRFTPHYDNPKCAIIFHLNDSDPITFYDERNNIIYQTHYKFALINTSFKHGIDLVLNDRLWFKVSISRYHYFQMREILLQRDLLIEE